MVVETTGLADPAPILHTLMTDPLLASRYRLDGVVTTVDGVNGASTLDNHEEAVKQAAVADRLLLTKSDIADAPKLAELKSRLHQLNPGAPFHADLRRRDRSQRDPQCRPLQSRDQDRRRQALAARGSLRSTRMAAGTITIIMATITAMITSMSTAMASRIRTTSTATTTASKPSA